MTLLKNLQEYIEQRKQMNTNREKLYQAAKASLGKEMSPQDVADDSLACVESFCQVYKTALGEFPNGMLFLSTIKLYEFLSRSPLFVKATTADPGTIVIAVTEGTRHGHIFIAGVERLYSNDSRNGLWLDGYTMKTARDYYEKKLGLKIHMFNRL